MALFSGHDRLEDFQSAVGFHKRLFQKLRLRISGVVRHRRLGAPRELRPRRPQRAHSNYCRTPFAFAASAWRFKIALLKSSAILVPSACAPTWIVMGRPPLMIVSCEVVVDERQPVAIRQAAPPRASAAGALSRPRAARSTGRRQTHPAGPLRRGPRNSRRNVAELPGSWTGVGRPSSRNCLPSCDGVRPR
jgi:hypothetical protein